MTLRATQLLRPLLRGDVVLVPFPFTDQATKRLRPSIILWSDPLQVDLTLAFISSQHVDRVAAGEFMVFPSHPEFGLTGLTLPSKVRTMKLVTLERALVRRWLGRLGPLLIADLDRALIVSLGINTMPYHEEGRRDEQQRLKRVFHAGGMKSLLADLRLQV